MEIGRFSGIQGRPIVFGCGDNVCVEWAEQDSAHSPFRMLRAQLHPTEHRLLDPETEFESITYRTDAMGYLRARKGVGEPIWYLSGLGAERLPMRYAMWSRARGSPSVFHECPTGGEATTVFSSDDENGMWVIESQSCNPMCTTSLGALFRVPPSKDASPKSGCLDGIEGSSLLMHPLEPLFAWADSSSQRLRLFRMEPEVRITELGSADLSRGVVVDWAFIDSDSNPETATLLVTWVESLLGGNHALYEFTYDGNEVRRRLSPLGEYIADVKDVRDSARGTLILGERPSVADGKTNLRLIIQKDGGPTIFDDLPTSVDPPQLVEFAGSLHAFWTESDYADKTMILKGERLNVQ